MTHWTEAADLIGEREGAAPGFVSRYLPGALAFTLSAALGAYLVYLRPLMHAPAPPAVAKVAPTRSAGLGLSSRRRRWRCPSSLPAIRSAAWSSKASAPPTDSQWSRVRFRCRRSRLSICAAPPEDVAPLPPRRPTLLSRPEPTPEPPTVARTEATPTLAPTPEAASPAPGVFEKLFGNSGSPAVKTPDSALAYATSPPASESASSALASRNGLGCRAAAASAASCAV